MENKKIKVGNIDFPAIFIKGKTAIIARCATLPVTTQGKDMKEAEKNLQEAIALHLEDETTIDQPNVTDVSFQFVEVSVKGKKVLA